MPYVLSLVLVVASLAGLLVLAVRAGKAVRELRSAQRQAVEQIKDRAGLLKARSAGLRIAFAERRRR